MSSDTVEPAGFGQLERTPEGLEVRADGQVTMFEGHAFPEAYLSVSMRLPLSPAMAQAIALDDTVTADVVVVDGNGETHALHSEGSVRGKKHKLASGGNALEVTAHTEHPQD